MIQVFNQAGEMIATFVSAVWANKYAERILNTRGEKLTVSNVRIGSPRNEWTRADYV